MKAALGKLLYPKDHPVLQRIKLRNFGFCLVLGLVVSVVVGIIFWLATQFGPGSSSGASHGGGSGASGGSFLPLGPMSPGGH